MARIFHLRQASVLAGWSVIASCLIASLALPVAAQDAGTPTPPASNSAAAPAPVGSTTQSLEAPQPSSAPLSEAPTGSALQPHDTRPAPAPKPEAHTTPFLTEDAPEPPEPVKPRRFGNTGVLVISGALSASLGHLDYSASNASTTSARIEPSFDYFAIRGCQSERQDSSAIAKVRVALPPTPKQHPAGFMVEWA